MKQYIWSAIDLSHVRLAYPWQIPAGQKPRMSGCGSVSRVALCGAVQYCFTLKRKPNQDGRVMQGRTSVKAMEDGPRQIDHKATCQGTLGMYSACGAYQWLRGDWVFSSPFRCRQKIRLHSPRLRYRNIVTPPKSTSPAKVRYLDESRHHLLLRGYHGSSGLLLSVLTLVPGELLLEPGR